MTNSILKKPQCLQLLSQLKSTVDELLTSHCVNILNVPGGLERLAASLYSILSHQYKANEVTNDLGIDAWPFVHEVLSPMKSFSHIVQAVDKSNRCNKSLVWLEKSLLTYALSHQLSILLRHHKILYKFYNDDSFLLQPQFTSALLICLMAIELNDPSLLAEVNLLKLSSESPCERDRTRSSSSNLSSDSDLHPSSKEDKPQVESSLAGSDALPPSLLVTPSSESVVESHAGRKDRSAAEDLSRAFDSADEKSSAATEETLVADAGRPPVEDNSEESGRSLQDVCSAEPSQDRRTSSKATEGSRRKEDSRLGPKTPCHGRSSSDIGLFRTNGADSLLHETRSESKFSVKTGKKVHQRHDSCLFKQPREGQSLLSFFMSHNFNSCTDLDRENAHFNFAETLLSVIERVRWSHVVASERVNRTVEKNDDSFNQRIRIRYGGGTRKQPLAETKLDSEAESFTSGSDGSVHEDEVDDASLSEFGQNLRSMKGAGLTLSMASLYSDSDFRNHNKEYACDSLLRSDQADDKNLTCSLPSADIIAINLLKRFSCHVLPRASDFVWHPSGGEVRHEDDLPAAQSANEDVEGPDSKQLRGSHEWAPPRPQIVCTVHERVKPLDGLTRQNNRCAGCGSRIEASCTKHQIFCEYLGKYFCPCCHNKKKSIVPARILTKWDFGLYPVSHFACDFLEKNKHEPWFNASQGLYDRVSVLYHIKQCRVQLHYLRQFIQVCRSNDRPRDIFECPTHWFASANSLDSFTIAELQLAKKKQFLPLLQEKVETCLSHVRQCIRCQARGFICEVCKNAGEVLFPFDIHRAVICQSCKASFHKQCFNPNSCPKCKRLLCRKAQDSRT